MLRYLNPFKPQALVDGYNTAYVVPNSCIAQVRALTFHNSSTSSIAIEVYLVPSNVSTPTKAQRVAKKTLSPDEDYLAPSTINHVLTEGMKVVFTGTGINATLSVVEQTV